MGGLGSSSEVADSIQRGVWLVHPLSTAGRTY